MPITLDDNQIAQLRSQLADAQRYKEVAQFAESIWNDPALSDEAKALAKKKYPNVAIPDYDLAKKVDDRFAKEKEEREKAEREKAETLATAKFKDQRKAVQDQYGFTDDAMDRMEKEMTERRVYDYEAMAPFFASKEPKPLGDQHGGHFWNHHKQDVFKQIVSDPEDYAFNEIARAVAADDQQRRSRI